MKKGIRYTIRMVNELKNRIEAVLFSTGKKTDVSLLKTLCDAGSEKEVIQQLKILAVELKEKESPLMLVEEGTGWKLTLQERYLDLVQNIVPETELTKTVLETLAVIAWKQPVLQSDVIKIRTNKAYDHIGELEEAGFISKSKQGRSYMIRATPKFFEYFDVPDKAKIQEIFAKVEAAAKKEDDVIEQDLDGLKVIEVEPQAEAPPDEIFDAPPEEPEEEKEEKPPEQVIKEFKEKAEAEEQEETEEVEEDTSGRPIDPELENILGEKND